MSSLSASATLTDVAFAVCTALDGAGEHAVLCGGSAATYYAPEAYESDDLDFVLRFGARRSKVDEALAPLGYVHAAGDLYRHPDIWYTVEFPPGPLAIGMETITAHATERRSGLVLHVYFPADVVRDRLMHYWAWGDQRALRVALAVAETRRAEIDFHAIELWTERELEAEPLHDRRRRGHFLDELRRVLH